MVDTPRSATPAAPGTAQQITVGAAIAQFLHHCDVRALFGVISIHNMPIPAGALCDGPW